MSKRTDDILEAATINVGACDFCPGVHIDLYDSDGELFATAVVPLENQAPFIAKFQAEARAVALRPAMPDHVNGRRQ